jgi:hypothetical protein
MEHYKIKINDYKEETEVRHEVVQMLIDYFTRRINTNGNSFCPNDCWRQTHSIGYDRNGMVDLVGKTTMYVDDLYTNVKRIRTSEMK